jgi:para-nitrobenzyl esterase
MVLPIVTTEYGQLRGVDIAPGVSAFLGIPYAAPPVGPLRWRPPEPPAAWPGVRNADAFGPDPIQPVGTRVSRAPGMAEDCLYLNVWAPGEYREGGWPVMVWSCGGAFTTGGGAFVEEDPARLAAKGAVVVSFNIRLGIYGFFAHPGLSAESPHGSSGNYGLYDQAAALAWVRDNIAAFNGDASKLTFFGESAGAAAGMLLLASPVVEKPFDRAILQSPGSFSSLLPLAEAERHGAALGDDIAALRDIPAVELPERAKQLPATRPSLWLARPMRPICDGWLIPSVNPFAGAFDPVPIIVGTNDDEGRFFGPRMGVKTIEDFREMIRGIFGERTEEALNRYPVDSDEDVPAMFSTAFGDRAFNYPVDDLARTFARRGAAVYRYVYSYRHGNTNRPPTHSEETGVLLDNLPHIRAEDAQMADIMARYWIAFAETGEPNDSGLLDWPVYNPATDLYLQLNVPLTVGAGWRADQVRFLANSIAEPA